MLLVALHHFTPSTDMQRFKCDDQEFDREQDLLRFIRTKKNVDVRWADGGVDRHNHMYYCMSCASNRDDKNHRSFDSEQAIVDHCRDKHNLCITIND